MIAFIEGTLEEKNTDSVVIDTGGVGYEIKVPVSVLDGLPTRGQAVRLYTYLQIREDAVGLFGFLKKEELDFFKMLIAVNGIGPKAALGILSAISADDLRFAIMAGDAKTISKAPGIGSKTASKIILELKDRVQKSAADDIQAEFEDTDIDGYDEQSSLSSFAAIRRDAVEALISLGYSSTQAHQAVAKVTLTEGMNAEQLLKMSLKYLYQ